MTVLPGMAVDRPKSVYDVVIVGAGIQGLATSYELAKQGVRNIAVLDRSWPGSGASGRNGEMIRSIFSSRAWTELFDLSVQRFAQLSAELDFNILFNPGGYLVLASTDDEMAARRQEARLQSTLGVDSEILDADQVRRLIPAINPELTIGGLLQPTGGFAHHDAVVWAYLRAAARMGVEVHSGVEAKEITAAGGAVTGVMTDRGHITAPVVVNTAGANAASLHRAHGELVPLEVARLEMLVTEAVKPFLPCALATPHLLGYCHQTSRGEFVGGTERPGIDGTDSLNTTYEIARDMAIKWTRVFPSLAAVRLMRSWAGSVSQTPDMAPAIGEAENIAGYYLSVGWLYGFMGAPAAAMLLAENIATHRVPRLLEPFRPARFAHGEPIHEASLVVAPGED